MLDYVISLLNNCCLPTTCCTILFIETHLQNFHSVAQDVKDEVRPVTPAEVEMINVLVCQYHVSVPVVARILQLTEAIVQGVANCP